MEVEQLKPGYRRRTFRFVRVGDGVSTYLIEQDQGVWFAFIIWIKQSGTPVNINAFYDPEEYTPNPIFVCGAPPPGLNMSCETWRHHHTYARKLLGRLGHEDFCRAPYLTHYYNELGQEVDREEALAQPETA